MTMTLEQNILLISTDLIRFSNKKLKGDDRFDWEKLSEKMVKQDAMIEQLKTLCKAANTILGRPFGIQKADGYAMYIITKINKTTVNLTWIDYSDGWIDDRVGYMGTYPLDLILEKIHFENEWVNM